MFEWLNSGLKIGFGKWLVSSGVAVCLLVLPVRAQYGSGNYAKIKQVANRKLIVVTEIESWRLIEQFRKKKQTGEAEAYKMDVARYNDQIREAVSRNWPFATQIQYMTYQDADKLRRTQTKDYAVLYCAHVQNFITRGDEGGRHLNGFVWTTDYKSFNTKRDHWSVYAVMEIKLIEELGKDTPAFSQNLSNVLPDQSDMVFGLQMLKHYARQAEKSARSENIDLLAVVKTAGSPSGETTLLIPKNWLHPYLTEKNTQTLYPYPCRALAVDSFSKLASSGDTSYAYVQIVPEVLSRKARIKTNYLHLVLNAGNGAIQAIYRPSESDTEDKLVTRSALREYGQQTRSSGASRKSTPSTSYVEKESH